MVTTRFIPIFVAVVINLDFELFCWSSVVCVSLQPTSFRLIDFLFLTKYPCIWPQFLDFLYNRTWILYYNTNINRHLIHRHRYNYCINYKLPCFFLFLISLIETPLNFIIIKFPQKNMFWKQQIGKYPTAMMKKHPAYFVLAPFHPKQTMSPLLFFYIEYWRSYRLFLSRKLKWKKIQNDYIVSL